MTMVKLLYAGIGVVLILACAALASEEKAALVRNVEIIADADGYGEVHVSAALAKNDSEHLSSLEVRFGSTVIQVPANLLLKVDGLLLRTLMITTCPDPDGPGNAQYLSIWLDRYAKHADGSVVKETVHFPIRRGLLETPYRSWSEGNRYRTEDVK